MAQALWMRLGCSAQGPAHALRRDQALQEAERSAKRAQKKATEATNIPSLRVIISAKNYYTSLILDENITKIDKQS